MSREELERRVTHLERQHRTRLLLVAVAAWIALVPIRCAPEREEMLTVRGFRLVDEAGRVRAELRTEGDAVGLYLFDDAGGERVSLSHGSEETALFLKDARGDTRVGVAQFAHGGGGFALHGEEAKGAAVLYLKQNGSLSFYDAEGELTHRVPPPVP